MRPKIIRKTTSQNLTINRSAFDGIVTEAGWVFWENGYCPVCTGKIPAVKYKRKGDPSLTLWVMPSKGQFEIKRFSKRVVKLPLNQLREALRLHK